jgi:hypothetical protein
MHPFMIVGGLLHATALAVVAFFVWFTATRAKGWLMLAGKVLGAWLILLALCGVVLAIFAPGMGHHHMKGWGGPPEAPAAAAPAPAANATP